MKAIFILIISLLAYQSLSIVIKKQTNFLSKIQGKSRAPNIQGYPEEILKELNYFRRKNHYGPFIRWHNPLAATAGREAQNIIDKHTFGQHANFYNWRKQHSSRFFTELALIVNTEGMMPPKRIFAKTVIEALKQEQEWYLIHGYTHAGVAIIPDKKPHHFIVVIHLIRTPSKFHSCKEASDFGIKKDKIKIFSKGKKIEVKCDQKTLGGGWTLVLERAIKSFGIVNLPINDLGLQYTEIFFKAKPNYYFDYAKGGGALANNWDFNGFAFPLQAFKFDNTWYMSEQAPTHVAERNRLPHTYYNKNDKNILQVIKGAEKCYFGTANKPEFCAKEFVLKKLPKGKLNGLSDVESILNLWTGDNQFDQFFEVYVR